MIKWLTDYLESSSVNVFHGIMDSKNKIELTIKLTLSFLLNSFPYNFRRVQI